MYKSLPSEGDDLRMAESALCQGLAFYACLLENPGVWDVEALNPGGQVDEQELAGEKFLTKDIFTQQTVN